VTEILKYIVARNHALNARSAMPPVPGMLNRALRRVRELARHDCLICLIGDATGIDDETRRHVTRLTEHNDVLSVFVYDPLERAMPEAGRLVFSDGGSQLEFDTTRRSARDAYRDDFQQRIDRMTLTSRRHAIPLLRISTAAGVLRSSPASLSASSGYSELPAFRKAR